MNVHIYNDRFIAGLAERRHAAALAQRQRQLAALETAVTIAPARCVTPGMALQASGLRLGSRALLQALADGFGTTVLDLAGHSRVAAVVARRHYAIAAIAVAFPAMPVTEIARMFGNRDHTTVRHALEKAAVLDCRARLALAFPGGGVAALLNHVEAHGQEAGGRLPPLMPLLGLE